MVPIEFLRQFRFSGYAIFDFAAAFLGIYLLSPLLSKAFLKLRIDIPKRNWMFLVLPIGIVSHLLAGNITPMTRDFIDEGIENFAGEQKAVYFEAAQQLLDPYQREGFYTNHLCQVRPAMDDRPYFHDFFRWRSLKTLRQLLGDNWAPFIDWGYLLLVAALIQSCILAALCIVLPLLCLRPGVGAKGYRLHTLVYFSGIGLAYMLLEISFIQRLALFLSHPVATVAVVLAGFLCFSGLGSYVSQRFSHQPRRAIMIAGVGIFLIGIIYLLWWDEIITVFQPWPWWPRCIVALVLQAPLAFLMGIPFPLGLLLLSRHAPLLTPWAWGINGFASVIATSLTVCIAISFGHSVVLLIAIGLYLAVAISTGTVTDSL